MEEGNKQEKNKQNPKKPETGSETVFHPQTQRFAYGNRQGKRAPKEIPFVAWVQHLPESQTMTDCESIICKLQTIQKPSPYPRQKEKRNAKRKEISDQKSGIQPNKTQKAYEVEKCKYDLDQNFSESTSAMMINAMNFRGVSQDTPLICCAFI